MRLFLLFVLVAASSPLFAKSRYYRFDDLKWTFFLVETKEMKDANVYLCERTNQDGSLTHFWVTRDHDDPILPGSILLGHRFGISRGRAIHFELNSNLDWVPVNPTHKPVVWRLRSKTGAYVAEEPMGDWWSGHNVNDDERSLKVPMYREPKKPERDPEPVVAIPETAVPKPRVIRVEISKPKPMTPPRRPEPEPMVPVTPAVPEVLPTAPATRPAQSTPVAPPKDAALSCEIELSTGRARVGDPVRISMKTFGAVEAANLDSAAVDFPFVMRMADTSVAGTFRIRGVVHGRSGDNFCEATLVVE